MTRYYHPTLDSIFYKALEYNVEKAIWVGPWRWSYDIGEPITINGQTYYRIKHFGIDVKKFQPDSRSDYYTQCMLIPSAE